ncbi:MAG: hypothetical protein ACKO5K_08265, partial [Armatimonadota bacterium]
MHIPIRWRALQSLCGRLADGSEGAARRTFLKWAAAALLMVASANTALASYSGAIYTTTFEGTTVNGNNYPDRESVYLNG